ncbi:MAG TPA: hypothetical protein VN885_05990 [Candidatus Acidoferrales bacterium]|nr:hypothetical protein [Candidatus Acidoferrales bacterium]
MKLSGVLSAAFAISLVAPSLFADTTVSYKYDIKPGAGAPARMVGPALEAAKSKIPTRTVIQIKGKLARATGSPFVTVSDFDKQVITVIDPAHNQFATVYMKDYQDQVLSLCKVPCRRCRRMRGKSWTRCSRAFPRRTPERPTR